MTYYFEVLFFKFQLFKENVFVWCLGSLGMEGDEGWMGDRGDTGVKGQKGMTGDKGSTGETGKYPVGVRCDPPFEPGRLNHTQDSLSHCHFCFVIY